MALKDLNKVPKSIFAMSLLVIFLVGLAVMIIITKTDDSLINTQVNNGSTQSITGLVTEVFKDCAEHLILKGDEVIKSDTVSCDGGSYIVMSDEVTIYTASGFVPFDQSFGVDIGDLKPGDTAKVEYIENEYGGYNLNCDSCKIQVIESR